MRLVWLFILVLFATFRSLSVEPVQKISQDSIQTELREMLREYGLLKEVPEELQATFYTALKYYPELKDVRIVVKYKNIKTTMQCAPRWDFFLHKIENRTYVISVDEEVKNDYGVLFSQLPLNAQIGVFGHELAHVIDYQTRNTFEIALFGIHYLQVDKKKKIENSIDLIAIQKGLGYQINDFSKYVFEDSDASFDYLKYKRKFYFRPSQIRKLIAENPIYYSPNEVLIE